MTSKAAHIRHSIEQELSSLSVSQLKKVAALIKVLKDGQHTEESLPFVESPAIDEINSVKQQTRQPRTYPDESFHA